MIARKLRATSVVVPKGTTTATSQLLKNLYYTDWLPRRVGQREGWGSPRSPRLGNRPGAEAWVERVPAPPWSP